MTQEDDLLERVVNVIKQELSRQIASTSNGKILPSDPVIFELIGAAVDLRALTKKAIAECYRWRDIKEAPKDGRFLAVDETGYIQIVFHQTDIGALLRDDGDVPEFNLTHFRPLGPGPEESK